MCLIIAEPSTFANHVMEMSTT